MDSATVVRFSQRLGFPRYADFRYDLRAQYLRSLEPVDLLREQDHVPPTDIVGFALQQDLRSLSHLIKILDHGALGALAARLRAARRTVVIGYGELGGVAVTLAHLLSYMGLPAIVDARGGVFLTAQVANLGSDDLLLAFSFWRRSRDVVQAFEWCRRHGTPVAVITDRVTAAEMDVDHCIVVPCDAISFFQSTTAALSVIHALVALIAATSDDTAAEAIRRSRSYNREFGVVMS